MILSFKILNFKMLTSFNWGWCFISLLYRRNYFVLCLFYYWGFRWFNYFDFLYIWRDYRLAAFPLHCLLLLNWSCWWFLRRKRHRLLLLDLLDRSLPLYINILFWRNNFDSVWINIKLLFTSFIIGCGRSLWYPLLLSWKATSFVLNCTANSCHNIFETSLKRFVWSSWVIQWIFFALFWYILFFYLFLLYLFLLFLLYWHLVWRFDSMMFLILLLSQAFLMPTFVLLRNLRFSHMLIFLITLGIAKGGLHSTGYSIILLLLTIRNQFHPGATSHIAHFVPWHVTFIDILLDLPFLKIYRNSVIKHSINLIFTSLINWNGCIWSLIIGALIRWLLFYLVEVI